MQDDDLSPYPNAIWIVSERESEIPWIVYFHIDIHRPDRPSQFEIVYKSFISVL